MLTGRAGLHFFLSSNSLPKRLLEPLPAVAWSWSLWNFQGTPHLSLLYLALFPGWMPRFFAYPCFVVVADFSSFPPDPTFGGPWEYPHLLCSMLPFCHIASSLLAISLLNYRIQPSSVSLASLLRTRQWFCRTYPEAISDILFCIHLAQPFVINHQKNWSQNKYFRYHKNWCET